MSANLKRTARVIKGITGYNNIFGQIILKGKHLDEYYEEFN